MKKSGVYIIICTITQKRYVGSSVDIERRRKTHFRLLNQGRHHSGYLQRAYSKYGEAAFTFEILEEVLPERKSLLEREQHWIDTLKPEYNLTLLAGSHLGIKRSPEAIERMKAAQADPDVKRRKSEALKGKKRSPEVIERMSQGHKGQVISEEHRKKISQKLTGYKMPYKRVRTVPVTEETREKWRKRNKRMWETRQGPSEATKRKISGTLTGRKLTDEQRQQRSESMKEIWRKRKENAN